MKYLIDTDVIINSISPKRSLDITLGFIKESSLQIIDLNQEVIFNFGQLKAGLEKLGQRLEDFDILIAATAIVKDLILVTKNIRHFQRIPHLKLAK